MERRPRIGVVLAGGQGRRFGGDKAWAAYRGTTLAAGAAATLRPLCERVVISLQPDAPNPAPGYEAVRDRPPTGRGPLAGIVRASEVDLRAELLVLACDYPLVDTARLGPLLERDAPLTIAVDEAGREHPLVALWRPPAIDAVRVLFDAGELRVGAVLERVAVERVVFAASPGNPHPLRNANRREDLAGG